MPSSQELRVLFITSEVFPLCKTGGLGDVSAALPAALRSLQTDVRLLLPGYPKVLAGVKYKSKVAEFNTLPQFPPATLLSARLSLSKSEKIPVFVIDCPGLYHREGGPYMDTLGRDWPDNALRFGLLSKIGAILSSDAQVYPYKDSLRGDITQDSQSQRPEYFQICSVITALRAVWRAEIVAMY